MMSLRHHYSCGVELAFLLQMMAIFASSDSCRYRFIEQPPNTMACNPYPSGRLVTRCAVEFTTTDPDGAGPLQFSWYFRTELGGNPQSVSMATTGHEFNSSILSSKAESTLIIQLQNGTSSGSTQCGDFRGYFCRVSLRNGTILSDSQAIYVFPQYTISSTLKNCEKQHVQLSRTATCVDVDSSTPESTHFLSSPTTTSRFSSVPKDTVTNTGSSSKSPVTPMSDQVVPQTSSFDKTSPPTTPSRPPPIRASTPPSQGDNALPTTLSLPSQDSLATASVHTSGSGPQMTTFESLQPPLTGFESTDTQLFPKNPSANEANMPTSDDTPPLNLDDILLYSAIVVVILLIMIVIGLVVCLCLCNKLCQKSKYCMC